MGHHVVKQTLSMPNGPNAIIYGFCGITGDCNIRKKNTTGVIEIPGSNCDYYCKFNLKSVNKSTKTKPLTNRPIECLLCKFKA